MKTPKERVEAEINSDFNMGSDKAGWPCCYVTADFARTLAAELEQAQATIKELQSWKSQMLQVWSQIDDQNIAAMLGAGLGESTFEVINRRVPEVLEKLKEAQARVVELETSAKSYPEELDECEKLAEKYKAEGDMYGWNFHMGRQSGIIHADIMMGERLRKSESGAAVMRSALQEIHTQAHCISKAGPLSTPTLTDAWNKFDMLAAIATRPLSTKAGKTMIPRAVLLECRDALQSLYNEQSAPTLPIMNTRRPSMRASFNALKSATQALGDSP